jgi:hypothetical protein
MGYLARRLLARVIDETHGKKYHWQTRIQQVDRISLPRYGVARSVGRRNANAT